MVDALICLLGCLSSFAAAGALWFLTELEIERQHHEAGRPGWMLRR